MSRSTLLVRFGFPAIAFAALVLAGCGPTYDNLGYVTGKVTLDGQPVENAMVLFQPPTGRASIGTTDADGEYELMYTGDSSGAVIGKHQVRITTGGEKRDDSGNVWFEEEKIPAKYNNQSELEVEVVGGSQTHDFPLES